MPLDMNGMFALCSACEMSLTRAIKSNQTALRRVVEEIFALLELVLENHVVRLPKILFVAANRLLVPAESALRRLIVIAAVDIKVKLPKPRPKRPKPHITPKGIRPLKFQLFDTRKRFDRPPQQVAKPNPRIHFFSFSPLVSALLPPIKKLPKHLRICRRFEAFKQALENIPAEAKRLALWQAKRALKVEVKFRFPLRPGPPPGLRRNLIHEIDHILKECHRLAIECKLAAPS